MNRVLFIIPIGPRDFDETYRIILERSQYNIKADIIFVFTYDYDKINHNAHNTISISLQEKFTLEEIEEIGQKKSYVTLKKWLGISYGQRFNYSYYVTMDAEVSFVRNLDIYSICERSFSNRYIMSGYLEGPMVGEKKINNESLQYLISGLSLKGQIDTNYYFWWSSLPVYSKSNLDIFFALIHFNDNKKVLQNISWFVFDYIVYQYFLINSNKLVIKKIPFYSHSLEFAKPVYYFFASFYSPIYWMNYNAFTQLKLSKFYFRNVVFIFHSDRSDFPSYSNFRKKIINLFK